MHAAVHTKYSFGPVRVPLVPDAMGTAELPPVHEPLELLVTSPFALVVTLEQIVEPGDPLTVLRVRAPVDVFKVASPPNVNPPNALALLY